jgi:hypothetical protein
MHIIRVFNSGAEIGGCRRRADIWVIYFQFALLELSRPHFSPNFFTFFLILESDAGKSRRCNHFAVIQKIILLFRPCSITAHAVLNFSYMGQIYSFKTVFFLHSARNIA